MKYIAEYIWLGGKNELRSKARVLEYHDDIYDVSTYPQWNFDGSSTEQAEGHYSEVIIKPVYVCPDPIRGGGNVLVFCATYRPNGESLDNNHYEFAHTIFSQYADEHPWFGMEQEYFLYDRKTGFPLGFSDEADAKENPQGQYYCSVGAQNAFGRQIVDEHMVACISAGLSISGVNAEVAVGQWEFQIGPVEGINAGHQMWIARYLLERICEKYDVWVNYEPKPLANWNGSGCHFNFSTEAMRNAGGIEAINAAIAKLEVCHGEHMRHYGAGNESRMTGRHETASYDKFTWGVANRGASVRVGNETVRSGCGYFEDRRPASNCDPYLVSALLMQNIH